MTPKTLALTLVLAAPLAVAQVEEEPSNLLEVPMNITFPGGTLQELLDLTERKLGTRPNYIVEPEAGAVVLPELNLRNVNVFYLVEAIERLTKSLDIDQTGGGIVVFRRERRAMRVPTDDLRYVQPFNIERYLETASVEDIVTAIETAWSLLGKGDRAEVRYHPETRLLIAAGTRDDISAVQMILAALEESLEPEVEEEPEAVEEPEEPAEPKAAETPGEEGPLGSSARA